jgi:hypothetical protein
MSRTIKLSNTKTKLTSLSRVALLVTAVSFGLPLFLSIGTALANVNDIKTWTGPHELSVTGNETYPPYIAMNKQGDGVAVWSQYKPDKLKYGVWAARFSKANGWEKPQRISVTVGQSGDPQAAIDAKGDIIVVWPEFNSDHVPVSTVWSNYYLHDRGWGRASKIQNDSMDAYFPQVVMDETGNAIAIWNQNNLTYDKTNIYAKYYNKDSGWQRAVMIQRDGSVLSDNSALVITGKGDAVALWTQYDSSQSQAQSGLLSSFFIKGQGWQEPEFITHDEAVSSSVASNKNGDTFAIWTTMNGQTYQNNVYASRHSAAGWSQGQLIQTNPNVDSTDVQIATDEHGNALAVWRGHQFTNFGETPIYVYANTYSKDAGWSADEIVDQAAPYSMPQLAMDAYGRAIAVWEKPAPNPDPYSDNHDIYAYHYSPTKGWDDDEAIENYSGDSSDPKVAISAQGDALAVWQQTDAIDGSSTAWSNLRYATP